MPEVRHAAALAPALSRNIRPPELVKARRWKVAAGLVLVVAMAAGCTTFKRAVRRKTVDAPPTLSEEEQVDAFDAGLPWYWVGFGFGAQALFMSRMVVQWLASERAKASVVPVSFWILSLLGAISLLTYFLRRGDPVGVAGQSFGFFVYARNLIFIRRLRRAADAGGGGGP